jgi:hypothetical protein
MAYSVGVEQRTEATGKPKLKIDEASVRARREELAAIVKGSKLGEAAVEGMTDWEVIESLERLWEVGTSDP